MDISSSMMRRLTLAIAFCASLAGVPAHGQTTKLRVADSFPAGHYVVRYATQFWMDEVVRRSDRAVQFEYYPGQQLGKAKDMLSLVQTGVADVAYVSPAYIADRLPLSSVVEMPFDYSSACAGTRAFWNIARGDGVLASSELTPLGVRVMFALMLPPNQIVLAKEQFEGLASLRGLKIRTSGGAKEQILRELEAVPIKMAAPEMHESMSRGTIDGLLIPLASLFPYELDKLAKSSTTDENFGAFIITYVISEASWRRLTPQQQKVLTEAGEATTARACKLVEDDNVRNIEKLRARGVRLVKLDTADRQRVNDVASQVRQEWAKRMEERGKPGTEILRAFEGALR